MPLEDENKNVATDEHAEPDEIREDGQTDNVELPNEPELLKSKAEELAADNARLRRENRQKERDAKRLQHENEEKDAKARVFSQLAEERGNRLADLQKNADSSSNGDPARKPTTLDQALAGLDLGDYIDEGDTKNPTGVLRLVKDLQERGAILTPAAVQRMLDERVTQERNSLNEQQKRITGLTSRYNASVAQSLRDPNSELRRESEREFEEYLRENPKADEAAAMEISIARAAVTLGVNLAKDKTNGASERRSSAGGAPRNRGIGAGESNPQVTQADVDRFSRYGSSEIPPELLKKMAKNSKERTTVWDREAARANR